MSDPASPPLDTQIAARWILDAVREAEVCLADPLPDLGWLRLCLESIATFAAVIVAETIIPSSQSVCREGDIHALD